jgi:hypothetical protein
MPVNNLKYKVCVYDEAKDSWSSVSQHETIEDAVIAYEILPSESPKTIVKNAMWSSTIADITESSENAPQS